ncbi:ABC transporter substrate-binding protein [Proteiniborus sp. MB09-C3]|uniref:ABC transporter substrate-binding protein n=1 Tax=Proteiniborus sp. MB09-C3 TaxID=3050072 RepID=UPI00255634A1|nr:ABC transporter substrate-binding protein [Proteiniborus sp. MB09-C3]WIV10521.1 ABC transporter substrate-binding protein [Proteiniborus sp. MB09-C3]
MKFKGQLCLLLVVFQIIILSGCGLEDTFDNIIDSEIGTEENIDNGPEYGGELAVPISYGIMLNPLLRTDKFMYNFNKLIFEGLFDIDKNLKVKNALAESYSFESDGMILNIKLKENVKWHDGEDFTAEDVKFTIDTIKYGLSNSSLTDSLSDIIKASESLKYLKDVRVINKYDLTLTFDRAYGDVLEGLVFPIVPKHAFLKGKDIKASYGNALAKDNYKPIGTGPYKEIEINKFQNVILESYKDYWGEQPYISKIIGKALKDEELAVTSFEAGQIDVTASLGVDWEKYAQNKKVEIYEYASNKYEFLGFNLRDGIFTGEKGKALKKAIAYAIDRQSIVQKVYMGHATRNDVPIHPESWLISDDANSYGYNVSKARQIIVSAGWNDVDGDGFFEDADGNKLTIRLITNSFNDLRRETANIIAENLTDAGIKVVKEYNENKQGNLTEEIKEEQWENVMQKISTGAYDITLLGWELSYIPNLSFAFHSSQINGGLNFIGYNNEKMDELLLQAQSTYRIEDKKKIYEQIQDLIIDDLPYVSLYFVNSSILVNSKVHGEIAPNEFNMYDNITKWYIPKSLQQEDALKQEESSLN